MVNVPIFTYGVWQYVADKPRPQGEVERGEHQGVVEAVPGGDRVQQQAEEGEGSAGVQPRQGQGGHAHQRQQGERQLEIIYFNIEECVCVIGSHF